MKPNTCVLFFVLFCFSVTMAQEVKSKTEVKTTLSTKKLNTTETAEDSIVFKDDSNNHLIIITDEGTTGSITIPPGSAPSTTTNKLYNVGTTLFFNGSALSPGGGATSINDLSDAKYIGHSLFLGNGSGINDDGNDNYNTAVGESALNSNTTGYGNTAVGESALYLNTTGNYNTANGNGALGNNVTGYSNTANGGGALQLTDVAYGNVATGYWALFPT